MEDLDLTTYHCACIQLLLASSTPVPSLPKRSSDQSAILPLPRSPAELSSTKKPHYAALHAPLLQYIFDLSPASGSANGADWSTRAELANGDNVRAKALRSEMVVRLEDGFEKRYLLRCTRCENVWGYMLDWASFGSESGNGREGRRDDVLYVLKGAVVSTADTKDGKQAG